jgi:hypothetical protein
LAAVSTGIRGARHIEAHNETSHSSKSDTLAARRLRGFSRRAAAVPLRELRLLPSSGTLHDGRRAA